MDMDPKPTIENPFEKKQVAPTTTPLMVAKPEPLYRPPYFVSQATFNFLSRQIELENLTADELPFIHKISLIIGKILGGRATPTVSDFEAAVQFRTLEYMKKIALGETTVDIQRHTPDPKPKKERIEFWKLLAQKVIEDYESEST